MNKKNRTICIAGVIYPSVAYLECFFYLCRKNIILWQIIIMMKKA
nr:MAG TPA: hypothetical protein [Caudoviricetes sp.]